jgi:hypothetical protein
MQTGGAMAKVALGVMVAVALAVLGYLYWMNTATMFACGNALKKEAPSKDSVYVAAFFEQNCGATTDYTSIVSLRRREDRFNGDKDEAILVIRGQCPVEMVWNERVLSVSRANSCDVAKRVASWRDVTISFHNF